jgi:ribose transport system substrate-binding protein
MRYSRRIIQLSAIANAVAIASTIAACSPPPLPGTGSGVRAAADDFLIAPNGAVKVDAKSSKPATSPDGKQFTMPYADVAPLPDGPVGDPAKTYTICFSQADSVGSWAVAQRESAMIEAARHPNLKVLYYNTNNDPLKQVQDMDSCLAQKADAIVVWPHSVKPLTPEIEKVKDSGTVVVGMERTVDTRDYSSWVYLDNDAATRSLAEQVGKSMNGQGVVVETDGALGSSPQILRNDGFKKALNELYPNIKIEYTAPTDYSRGQGYKVALDYLQAHQNEKIGAWYSQYTEIGYGVNQALKDYHLADTVPQFSIVDGKTAVTAVKDGIFTALSPWNPVHGDLGIRLALYHVLGKPVAKDYLLEQPPVITKDNADQALASTWEG